jgi:nucleotide-binding universal stress UspA family protein
MATLRHIVVGIDGSENARCALDWAITLARPAGARITAVHALGLLDRLGDEPVPTASHRDAVLHEFRATWCAPLDDAAIAEERVATDGPPADVILGAALDADADLIVVGERGAGGDTAREMGSTSRRVLESSDRPVLVVPRQRPR